MDSLCGQTVQVLKIHAVEPNSAGSDNSFKSYMKASMCKGADSCLLWYKDGAKRNRHTSATASLVAPSAVPPSSSVVEAAAEEVEEVAAEAESVCSIAARALLRDAFSARSSPSSLSATVAAASASGFIFICKTCEVATPEEAYDLVRGLTDQTWLVVYKHQPFVVTKQLIREDTIREER